MAGHGRRWAACPGSGQAPLNVRRDVFGVRGICPICQRWIAVAPRKQTILPHARAKE